MNYHTQKTGPQPPRRCVYCGQQAALVWVHGHGQCSACGINVEECCRGESCGTELPIDPPAGGQAE